MTRPDRPVDEPPVSGTRLQASRRLAVVLIAAALLRFAALGQNCLWYDELATLQRLGLSFGAHLRSMRGNHPLYELLLRLWASPESSDVWLRLPSAALGVLAVWMTWLLMRSAGRSRALLAACFMAFSPLHLMFSRIGRAYSLACTLAVASNLALVWALRRRRTIPIAAYVLATTLMIYSNLVAGSVWIAQAIFVLWFYRGRLRRVGRWAVAHVCVAVLLLPWLIYSMPGAMRFGTETVYTAQQHGRAAKAAYLAFTLCLGETVSPLNLWVVPVAAVCFGAAMIAGVISVFRRRRRLAVLLLAQVILAYVAALLFGAAAPKHLTILLPAWCGLLGIGLSRFRVPALARVLAAAILLVTCASIFNYFAGREYADADMVTPWREMAAAVERKEGPGDKLFVGYRMDRGAYDMLRRYYAGKLQPEYFDFENWRDRLKSAADVRVWLLLHVDDPYADIEKWCVENEMSLEMKPFQFEEQTLRRIREGAIFGAHGNYRRPLYRLYRIGGMLTMYPVSAESER